MPFLQGEGGPGHREEIHSGGRRELRLFTLQDNCYRPAVRGVRVSDPLLLLSQVVLPERHAVWTRPSEVGVADPAALHGPSGARENPPDSR